MDIQKKLCNFAVKSGEYYLADFGKFGGLREK